MRGAPPPKITLKFINNKNFENITKNKNNTKLDIIFVFKSGFGCGDPLISYYFEIL